MKCPDCNSIMKLAERRGVEIKYCTGCKGIWFNQGEWGKILQHYRSERISMLMRFDSAFTATFPEPLDTNESFESEQQRSIDQLRHPDEVRHLEEVQFDEEWDEAKQRRQDIGGLLGEIFNLFD